MHKIKINKKQLNANGEKNIGKKRKRIINKTKKLQNHVRSKSHRPVREFKSHFAQNNLDTLNLKFSCFKP
jgi:hypothetical protein